MSTANPFIAPTVAKILREVRESEELFDNELRKFYRGQAILPIKVVDEEDTECFAFTKNVSQNGVCLISPQPFFDGDLAHMNINGLNYETGQLPATCRWSKRFGISYWASGWEFNQDIELEKLLNEDRKLNFGQRENNRERIAIPVMVHPKSSEKLHCFSRDLGADGTCLIGKVKPKLNEFSLLEIVRSTGERVRLVAECKWNFEVGSSYWISGWHFPEQDCVLQAQLQHFE